MNKVIKKKGVTFGIILGACLSLLTIYSYTINIGLLVSQWLFLLTFAIVLVVGILAIASTIKGLEGFITFKQAFSSYFITIVIGFLIHILTISLVAKIFPEKEMEVIELRISSLDKIKEDNLANQAKALETAKSDEEKEQIKESFGKQRTEIETMKKNSRKSPGFKTYIQAYASYLTIYSILGLLLSLILRRKRPELN
ncbi:DUF4199 domain-containing protein [Aureivirga sp. CE67]|uniref:DUF4199 domain-containing protein n=1 Tax=Aureivirga sp. CE67 TaxID=1788983 RepID=UPI0018C9A8CD|nr:DUF4199 domain-containing protein [Aureivirga sp. CE67]